VGRPDGIPVGEGESQIIATMRKIMRLNFEYEEYGDI